MPRPSQPARRAIVSSRARGLILLFVFLGLSGFDRSVEAARSAEAATIRFRYNKASLAMVLEDVARATRERFIFDRALPGRFTAIVPRKVTRSEALSLLEAMLLMQGYALMRGPEDEWQVLPIRVASSGAPWTGPALDAERANLITTMIDLETADAQEISKRISHLVSKEDVVVAYPESNSLLLAGSQRRIRRIIELARALDTGGLPDFWVRTLRHRDVLEIEELWSVSRQPDQAAGEGVATDSLKVLTDERTNSLIVYGPDGEIGRLREFVEALDVPETVDGGIRVVRVYHRDAEVLAEQLVKMAIARVLVSAERAGHGTDALGAPYAIAADPATNSLVVDADPETLASLLDLIDELDQPLPRVQVDVIAYEVSNPIEKRLGIDFFVPVIGGDDPGKTSFTIESNPAGGRSLTGVGPDLSFFGRVSRQPLVLPFLDESGILDDIVLPAEGAVITAKEREVSTRVLLRPRLMMSSGEEQEIFVGENIPIPVAQGNQLAATQTSTRVERQDVGINLRITPHLGVEGEVSLDLLLELSAVGESVAGSVEIVGPTLLSRVIETKVVLADGELAVIGLTQEGSETGATTGTPFLQELPVLGPFMRSRGTNAVDTHIVFAVQAHILRSHGDELADYMRQRLALERSQSRVLGLERRAGQPYAILVATRSGKADAQAIADSFEREGLEAQVGRWERDGKERFDVYLSGYPDLSLAGSDALQLRERGWAPRVVVLPGEVERTTPQPLRSLGSRLSAPARQGVEAR